MCKDWDKAVIPVPYWKEALRVLKPGAFCFVMSAPRQDVMSRVICNLQDAGFNTGFTSMYWAYASGFPKASNIGKMVDRRECKKQLEKKLGRKPTKKEFKDAWKNFREVVGYDIQGKKSEGVMAGHHGWAEGKVPITKGNSLLEGSYAGFQPKPAVEVILVAMKPLSEKTYVDQALKNRKGITWMDDCKMPYESDEKVIPFQYKKKPNGYGYENREDNPREVNHKGRFPPNLLVSDDALNDGVIRKNSPVGHKNVGWKHSGNTKEEMTKLEYQQVFNDSGSFSRYFDLDKWFCKQLKKYDFPNMGITVYAPDIEKAEEIAKEFEKRVYQKDKDWTEELKKLSESVQKTFPFFIVPKPSKDEKNRGLDGFEEKKSRKWEHDKGMKYTGSGKPRIEKDKNYHPTVKPIKLMTYLITLGSREGDIVLDPFVGSGTTCIACKMLNRKYIGIDNNEEYVKIAKARIKAVPLNLFSS